MKSSLSSGPKLRSQLLILIITIFIPVSGILFFTGYKEYEKTIREIKNNAHQLISLFSYEQLQIVAQTQQFLKILSNVPLIRDFDLTECNSFLQTIHTENTQYSTIVVTNNKGIVECCAIPLKKSINLSDRSWFRRISKNKEFIIGNFIISRSAKKASLPFAYPILNSEGNFLGVVGAAYDLSCYDEIFKKLPLPRDSIIILTDRNGKILFQSNGDPKCIGKPINDCRGFNIPDKTHGDFDVNDTDRIKRTYHFKRLFVGQPSNELCLLVGFSKRVIFAEAKSQLITNIAILCVIAISSLLMVWLIGRRLILNPVNQLIERAQQIQKGDLSYTRKPTKLPKELHILSIAFEKMLTELINREKALQKSEQLYREIVEGTENLVTEVDAQGRFVFVNEASRKIFELQPSDCIGRVVFDFVHPDDKEETLRHFSSWIKNKETNITFENRQISQTGNIRNMLWTVKVYYNNQSEVTSIRSIARDISDRKKAEIKLKESEQYFKAVLRGSQAGIGLVVDRYLKWGNNAMYQMLGYEKDALLGKSERILYPNEKEYERVGKIVYDGLGKSGIGQAETTFVKKDGTIFECLLRITPLDPFDSSKGQIATITDISELKEALTASKEKSEFLANMSHEIRTPLNAVTGFSELLSSLVEDDKQKSYLEAIKSSGKNLLNLINDILDLSKIEAGKFEIQKCPASIESIANEIKHFFQLQLIEKNIQFIITIDNRLPSIVLIDEIRLRQVLINIIGNAVKFTKQGHIKLSVEKEGKMNMDGAFDIKITVEDTGIGICEKELDSIFESFKQQKGQDISKFGGTGLGLTISKRLIEMMNGKIDVESEVGKGSIFKITIKGVTPSSVESETRVSVTDNINHENTQFKKGKILVVDDIESNRHLLRELLLKVGLDVIIATNGREAVNVCSHHLPDVILMDIRMPIQNGFEATEKIKGNETTQNIPIIAVTASSSTLDEYEILEKGFDGFLAKPVEINQLLSELLKYLEPIIKDECVLASDKIKRFETEEAFFPKDLSSLSKALTILDNGIIEQWNGFEKTQPIKDVRKFAKQIEELGLEYDIVLLSTYGKCLFQYANNFDVKNMQLSLQEFPQLIEKLKGIKENFQ